MRIAARYWHAVAAVLLVLAPLVLLRAARTEQALFPLRGPAPGNNVRPAQLRRLQQQELFGINPERLILYAPADTGALAIPRH
jgi:hypothetical protein